MLLKEILVKRFILIGIPRNYRQDRYSAYFVDVYLFLILKQYSKGINYNMLQPKLSILEKNVDSKYLINST